MPTRKSSGLMPYAGTFFTSLALALMTFNSGSLLTTSDPKFAGANTASLAQGVSVTKQKTRHHNNHNKWIEIILSQQKLLAREDKKIVSSYRISTGKRGTPTPIGNFEINSKYRINRMRGKNYDIPDVPYAMYFYGGYAIHGAYWHRRFGTPVSHGCVNLPVRQARKLYNWAAIGTKVVIRR